jgi:hypothetical protein
MSVSEQKHSEEEESANSDDEISDKSFCFSYYKSKYSKLRNSIIKDLFIELTAKWGRNFVIYPLTAGEDLQLMISKYYLILYEVDAPLKVRFQRFTQKY